MKIKNHLIFHRNTKTKTEGLPINWLQYLPTPEDQKFEFDTDACMSFSSTHTLETLFNYMNKAGLLPSPFVQFCTQNGYFDANGSFAFSVRFNAIMNATDPSVGADFDQVWNGMANNGCIPKSMFNFSMVQAQADPTQQAFWNDYFNPADVTPAMKALGQKFKSFIDIQYDWIISSGFLNGLWNVVTGQSQTSILQNALLTAPVHCALYPCPSWNSGMVTWCGNVEPQHGVEAFKANQDISTNILDQYNPFIKTLEPGYVIPYAVTPKLTFINKPVYTFNNLLLMGSMGNDVNMLQKCLSWLGFLPLSFSNCTFYYGQMTAAAMLAFQVSQGIEPTAENNFGPRSRAAMNALFSQ